MFHCNQKMHFLPKFPKSQIFREASASRTAVVAAMLSEARNLTPTALIMAIRYAQHSENLHLSLS